MSERGREREEREEERKRRERKRDIKIHKVWMYAVNRQTLTGTVSR